MAHDAPITHWKTKGGATIPITEMSSKHLANAIRVISTGGSHSGSDAPSKKLLALMAENERRQREGIHVPDTGQAESRLVDANSPVTSLGRPSKQTFMSSSMAPQGAPFIRLHMMPAFESIPEGDLMLAIERNSIFETIILERDVAVEFAHAIIQHYYEAGVAPMVRIPEPEALSDEEAW